MNYFINISRITKGENDRVDRIYSVQEGIII